MRSFLTGFLPRAQGSGFRSWAGTYRFSIPCLYQLISHRVDAPCFVYPLTIRWKRWALEKCNKSPKERTRRAHQVAVSQRHTIPSAGDAGEIGALVLRCKTCSHSENNLVAPQNAKLRSHVTPSPLLVCT